jgi:ribose transport system ATP-binding protein
VIADLERATHQALVELLAPTTASHVRAGRRDRDSSEVVLTARSVQGPRLYDVSLVVEAGEIVGLAGLAGSGARELLLTVCGAVPFTGGSITLGGRPLRSRNALLAVECGVGFLPGDRSLATFPGHTLRHNVSLPALSRYARLGFIRASKEKTAVASLLDRVALRANPEALITSLSGGNQQKALVGRWIGSNARLLLLDDPTAGVDVATRPEMYAQIRALSDAGVGVLLVSTDAEELAELSDRVVVFERGAIIGELTRERLTPASVLAAMTGRALAVA